ncbi:hypothetical protein [Adhaeribacter pallidiroseus]|uniref:Secreted protein n=1 Tax=Adhaeribacter pallidiroseus TaxID=2072847 RepID=A0A369QH10_9BACT|nr:hypothetical protein [Adhaeribacter pallidiroseus]RDC61568.1 hypothetical protein AHMF7616_00147 [Adhaeribacter pallidiroseus]
MKKFSKIIVFLFTVTLLVALADIPASAQCALCRSSVESNRADDKLSKFGNGLNKGILFLMSVPYILVGTVGFLWYRNNRKK